MEIGGTFTTWSGAARGVIAALDASSFRVGAIDVIVHGTTTATNAAAGHVALRGMTGILVPGP